jgi:hypothetical protein
MTWRSLYVSPYSAAAPPAAPPFMVVTLASANSVLLAWQEPESRGSPVGEYEVAGPVTLSNVHRAPRHPHGEH